MKQKIMLRTYEEIDGEWSPQYPSMTPISNLSIPTLFQAQGFINEGKKALEMDDIMRSKII